MRRLAFYLLALLPVVAFGQPRETGLTLLPGSALHVSPGSRITLMSGTLRVPAEARLQNLGLVQVNGAVTIDGEYVTRISGTAAGTDYGQVVSSDFTDLDGSLSAKLLGDYSPAPEARFDLFVANPVSGMFAAEDLPAPDWALDYTTNFVRLAKATVFPVTWLHFTGRAEPAGARLDWATATEHGTDFFGVERLDERDQWQEIARLPAAGEAEVRTDYTYLDPSPAGTRYYRLRQTDRDGAFTYSEVVAVSFGGYSPVTLYPNPSPGFLFLTGGVAGQTYRITDVHGRTVAEGRLSQAARIDLPPTLPTGLYVLHSATGPGLRFTLQR